MTEGRAPLVRTGTPGVDIESLERRIQEALAGRQEFAPLRRQSLKRCRDLQEHGQLLEATEALKRQIHDFGRVDSVKTGWRGRLELFFKRVIRRLIKRHLDQQQHVNQAMLATLDLLGRYIERKDDLDRHRLLDVEADLVDTLKGMHGSVEDRMDRSTRSLQAQLDTKASLEELRALSNSFGRLLDGRPGGSDSLYTGPSSGAAFDYLGFEQKYRGKFDEIKERLGVYLPFFRRKDLPILDIGCGRAEMVELLVEAGFQVRGVDLTAESVEIARDRGLPVVEGDGFAELSIVPDESLGGIFLGQVIEHLEPGDILRLIHLAHQKLADGGVFIAETPNPQCLLVFAESFYMDPSHEKPIHPLTLEFVLQSAGFKEVSLRYSSPASDLRLPRLEGDGIQNLEAFNGAVERLNGILYGCRDFAGIAYK